MALIIKMTDINKKQYKSKKQQVIEALPDSSVVWSVSVFSLILQLIQCWEVVKLQRLIALLPSHSWTTATLPSELVTYIVH